MYQITDLSGVGLAAITACFNEAFSDYALPARVSEAYLEKRFSAENVRYELSAGAFEDGVLIGFIVNAVGDYCGGECAYDAATGVAPRHRGNGLYRKMCGYVCTALREKGISRYCVEVLQSNERAIRLYTDMGFRIVREYDCFKGKPDGAPSAQTVCEDIPLTAFDLERGMALCAYPPSFENARDALIRSAERLRVCFAPDGADAAAFAVYDRATGEVKLIGRRPGAAAAVRNVLAAIGQEVSSLSVFNIDFRDVELRALLRDTGLIQYATQYEMELSLN